MKRVLIVILNFHQYYYIDDLIKSILKQYTSFDYRIVIGDVEPTQEEIDEITKTISRYGKNLIFYEIIKGNHGYAKGNNFLIKKYSDIYAPDYVVISNSDIEILDDNCLLSMFNELENNEDIALIGPKIIWNNKLQGPYNEMNVRRMLTKNLLPPLYYLIRKKEKKYFKNLTSKTYVWRTMGCFFMINFSHFKQVGFFDESTFLYWEEDILSYKLSKKEKKVLYMPEVKVLHKHESENSSRKFNKNDYESMLKYFEITGHNKFNLLLLKFSSLIYKYFWQHFLK